MILQFLKIILALAFVIRTFLSTFVELGDPFCNFSCKCLHRLCWPKLPVHARSRHLITLGETGLVATCRRSWQDAWPSPPKPAWGGGGKTYWGGAGRGRGEGRGGTAFILFSIFFSLGLSVGLSLSLSSFSFPLFTLSLLLFLSPSLCMRVLESWSCHTCSVSFCLCLSFSFSFSLSLPLFFSLSLLSILEASEWKISGHLFFFPLIIIIFCGGFVSLFDIYGSKKVVWRWTP